MRYFAYGSNIDEARMRERNINFSSRQFAILRNYKLVFNKKAKSGDYVYANIVAVENEVVEGALYEFPSDEISKLDKAEGFPYHYQKIHIVVSDKYNTSFDAITYIANKEKIVDGLLPQKNYINHLLAGKDILTPSYFEMLLRLPTL